MEDFFRRMLSSQNDLQKLSKIQKELKTLKKGQQFNYQSLEKAFKYQSKQIDQINGLGFIGISKPYQGDFIKFQEQNQENNEIQKKYIVIKHLQKEKNISNGKINPLQEGALFVNAFKLVNNFDSITVQLNNKVKFMHTLFKPLAVKINVKNEIFYLKLAEEAIAVQNGSFYIDFIIVPI